MNLMKNIFVIIFTALFSFFYLHSFAQGKDEMLVKKVLQTQQSAWNNGSIEKFMEGYWKSDSLMFIGKSGITYGWQKISDNYKRSYPDTASMGKLHFSILQLKALAIDAYFMVGKWHLERAKGNIEG